MPVIQPGGGSTQTIGDVFQSRKLWAWFSSNITKYYDGQTEKGQDYAAAYGTPVGAAVGGNVVRIVHNNNSIGDVVELQDSSGAVWLYQHITAKVKVGQTIGCGGIIGTENGLPIDQYSTGPHIEVRYCPAGKWSINTDSWSEPWVNPRSIFAGLATQQAGTVDTNAGSIGSAIAAIATAVHLAPDASVPVFLSAIDVALELRNPFQVNITAAAQDFTVLGIDTGIPNPGASADAVFSGVEQVFGNIVNDASALIVRGTFLLIGVIILWMVISQVFMQGMNQVLEPVGGVQGAVKIAGALA